MNDEVAWLVAGRLMLVSHLSEAREGWLTPDLKWHHHEQLHDKWGYSTASLNACPCGLGLRVEEVPLGTIKVAQIAS